MTPNSITPDQVASTLKELGDEGLATLSHALLYQARERIPREQQNLISPFEHRAFAREAIAENPLMALPIAASIPAYQLYKLIDGGSRSSPSIDQVLQGFIGVGEGLSAAINKKGSK